jgi:hypothetical protein
VTAFTEDGIENLRQIIVDERTAGRAPPSIKTRKIAPAPAVLTAWKRSKLAREAIVAGTGRNDALMTLIVGMQSTTCPLGMQSDVALGNQRGVRLASESLYGCREESQDGQTTYRRAVHR